MTHSNNDPSGFILSESAFYAFRCQDIYPDILSFASAIPDHLKPLFLIPVKFEKFASSKIAEGYGPSGNTPEGDLFSYQTFNYQDNQDTVPSSDPGSIFEIDDADDMTHHQEYNFDENIQAPSDTSFNTDIDITDIQKYPYRTEEKPVRHSSAKATFKIAVVRLALKPEYLQNKAPTNIKNNSASCRVSLLSYDKRTRVFTFSVDCGNGPKDVQATLSEIDHVALSCNCPFWKWNGPEFHAVENKFMLGQPFGSAETPNVRDPNRKYWLCKHAYAVLRRLDTFVQDIVDENWDKDEDEIMGTIDKKWDKLEDAANVPLEEIEKDDVKIEVEEPEVPVEPEELPEELPEAPIEEPVEPEELPEEELEDYEVPEEEEEFMIEEEQEEEQTK